MGGEFDAGSVVGRMELALEGWKKSVETVKQDQESLAGFALRHREEIQKLGQQLAITGAAVVGSLGLMVKSTADLGDEINDFSQRTGVSTEILSGYKLAADKSGASIEDLAIGVKGLADKLVAANGGNKEAVDLFGKLGVSTKDADGKMRNINDVLLDTADRFSNMEKGATKTNLAVDLFGKSGMNLIPFLNLGRQGLQDNYEAAEKLGIIFSKDAAEACDAFNDSLRELQAAGQGLFKTIAMSLMPAIKDVADVTKGGIGLFNDVLKALGPVGELITGLTGGFGLFSLATGTALIAVAKFIKDGPELKMAAEAMGLGVKSLTKDIDSVSGALKGLPLIAASAFTGWKIGEAINELTGLKKLFMEMPEAMHGTEIAESKAMMALQQMRQEGDLAGVSIHQLKDKYGTWQAALEAVTSGADKTIAAKIGLKKKADELAEAMKLLGVETKDIAEKKLRDYEKALMLARNTGQLSQDKLQELAGTARDLADTYDLKLSPAVKNLLDPLADATAAAIAATEKNIKLDLSVQDLQGDITPLWPLIYQMAKAQWDATSPAEQLKIKIEELSQELRLSPATIELVIYEMDRLQAAYFGIHLPDLRIPEQTKADVKTGVDTLKGYWDGLFNDVSQKWGMTIQDLIGGNTSVETAWNRLWENLWETVVTYVGKIVTEWMVKGVQGIIGGADEAANKSGDALGKIATKVTDVAGSVIKSIGDIVGAILDVIEDIAKTVIDIVSYGIETLADAIASAIKSLAAAAPELLELGLVAAAIYGAFKLAGTLADAIGSILGGGGKQSDVTYWLKFIKDDMKRTADFVENLHTKIMGEIQDNIWQMRDRLIDIVGWLSGGICGKLDEIAQNTTGGGSAISEGWLNSFFILGQDIRNKINDVVGAIRGLKGAQHGAISYQTELLMVHGSSSIPEITLPLPDLNALVSNRAGGAEAAGAPIYVENRITINALDGASVEKLFRTKGREIIDDMFRRNAKGLTTNLNLYLARQGA